VFLLNSRLGLFTAAPSGFHPTEAPLLPKLRGHFAEFLNESSSARLRILFSPTCVGLRYGHPYLARSFSWQLESMTFSTVISFPITAQPYPCADLPAHEPCCLDEHFHPLASFPLLRHSITVNGFEWYRNINLLSFDYAFRPHLRSRLTLSGRTFLRNP
jgi:hypothetical protein